MIFLSDLIANPGILMRSMPPAQKCAECDGGLGEGKHPSPKGAVCVDCYYGLFGAEIEQHPIGRGGRP
jgi:hypothetical protein